ncbi:MAG: alpha/beta fold hydrolase [Alphaproteobacteria bacterium]|nr:MAG: alpha/beta fold hydrolase [Alphaproteobacteria bacterium]
MAVEPAGNPKDELIRLIYQAALEPDNFMDLVKVLEGALVDLDEDEIHIGMVRHLDTAAQLSKNNDSAFTSPTICSVTFDRNLVLRGADENACKDFGFLFGDLVSGQKLSIHSIELEEALKENLQHLQVSDESKKLIVFEHTSHKYVCYLGQTSGDRFVLTLLRNHYLDEIDLSKSLLQGLTKTEQSVCRGLFEGLSSSQIAQSFNVAPSTVKSHIKSIFSKLGLNRQVDLIRLMDQAFILEREFETLLAEGTIKPDLSNDLSIDKDTAAKKVLIGKSGRRIAFRDYGPPEGQPVLYFHGAFSCGRLSDFEIDAMSRQNLRVVAVDRPGYGATDPVVDPDIRTAALDVTRVLDELGLEEVDVLGFGKGAFFALHFAQKNPERVKTVTLCSTSFGTNYRQDKPTRPAQIMATFLRRFPGVTRSMANLYLRRISDSLTRSRIQKTWAKSPPDKAALEEEALLSHLVECGHEAFSNGVEGIVYDYLALRDAEVDLTNITQPVAAFHGGHDISLSLSEVRSLLAPLPDLRLIAKRDKGQMLFHTDIAEIAQMISRS